MGAMRAPKILAVASSADLGHGYGCTPAWWQLWKGLYEAGADLIVTTYRGHAIESPWWRAVGSHRHAFVFYRDALPPIVPKLRQYGYRAYDVGSLVVYDLPRSAS